MSIAAPMLLEKANQSQATAECRVYQRHACELPTSCQPASVAEMRETRWAATICDISQGGVGLRLKRRYEKGAALAVELPGNGEQRASVVFVRVAHVKRNADNTWRLGCTFISELSDDDVRRLLSVEYQEPSPQQAINSDTPSPSPEAAALQVDIPADKRRSTYSNVRAEIEDRGGASFKFKLRQLNVGNSQSVMPGELLHLVGGISQGNVWSFRIEVAQLKQVGDQWNLQGLLVEPGAVSQLIEVIRRSKVSI